MRKETQQNKKKAEWKLSQMHMKPGRKIGLMNEKACTGMPDASSENTTKCWKINVT